MRATIALDRDNLKYVLLGACAGYAGLVDAEGARLRLPSEMQKKYTEIYDVELESFQYKNHVFSNFKVKDGALPEIPTIEGCIDKNRKDILKALM